ncbi:hypothetical protein MUN89_15515 [Halobacillus salinarum]|uniref:Uncharacterized protein n=1 Tax=Halobacillus salinarum TaxID=2932257 RepID=A0ABY4EGX8_9BACI|nr:hypothetical protein [Halobacillus salinarum]UOQ43318.1 hypothetical protein MUN89_15515 [Halobacillus salinarum]
MKSVELEFYIDIYRTANKHSCSQCQENNMQPRRLLFPNEDHADVLLECAKCGGTLQIKMGNNYKQPSV